MAAGLGFKTFTTGEVLTAADTNGYLMQGVLVFASAAARDAAITSPQEGQCCYLKDTDAVQTYSGSAWVGFDDSNAIQNSIVDAKGDIVAASGNDTPARLAVGSNGDTLVADSSQTTGLRYNPQNALANPIINGGMDNWQRGTSIVGGPVTRLYTADRWQADTGTQLTFSRQAVNDSTNLPNIQYAARCQRTAGSTSVGVWNFVTSVETAMAVPLAGKTVTLSFYAKRGANYSATSNLLGANLFTGTGTDQNVYTGYTGSVTTSNSVTLTTSWQRFVIVYTFPTTMTEFALVFTQTPPASTAGADDWFEITGVQIDLGTYTASTAPSFRRSGGTIQGELAACQRYCFAVTSGGTDRTISQGTYYNSTTFVSTVAFPVTMRTTPSATIVTSTGYWVIYGNNTADGADAASFGGAGLNAGNLEITGNASGTQGTGGQLRSNNAAASVILSAEL
jgi:hypothetical protein